MFTKKGVITIAKSAASEDKLTEIVLEAGAEDLSDEGENWEVLCDPKDFEAVTEALKAAKITPEHAEVTKIASTYTKLEGSQANAMMRLLDVLEDLDDTQNVYSNFDFDEAAKIAAGNPCLNCGLFLEVRPIDPQISTAYIVTNETPNDRRPR